MGNDIPKQTGERTERVGERGKYLGGFLREKNAGGGLGRGDYLLHQNAVQARNQSFRHFHQEEAEEERRQ